MNEPAHKGFALIIAIFVVAVILSLALSTINTAIKEVILASTSRNSLAALYIADSGAECIYYWDNIRNNFDKESAFTPGSAHSAIECDGRTINLTKTGAPGNFETTGMIRDPSSDGPPCVLLNVKGKRDSNGIYEVVSESWGFNTCRPNNPRRVDRAFELTYTRSE